MLLFLLNTSESVVVSVVPASLCSGIVFLEHGVRG